MEGYHTISSLTLAVLGSRSPKPGASMSSPAPSPASAAVLESRLGIRRGIRLLRSAFGSFGSVGSFGSMLGVSSAPAAAGGSASGGGGMPLGAPRLSAPRRRRCACTEGHPAQSDHFGWSFKLIALGRCTCNFGGQTDYIHSRHPNCTMGIGRIQADSGGFGRIQGPQTRIQPTKSHLHHRNREVQRQVFV
jgi:hypothetical protein